jgi:hypothetical protein
MFRYFLLIVFLTVSFARAAAPPVAANVSKEQTKPIGNMDPIQTIQYVGGIACKEYGCSQQISKIMGVATFHQECGARVNCTEHAASYKGSFALDTPQFNSGIAAFLPIAQKNDPVLYEALSALKNKGGDGRYNHLLSAAAWHGNNARYFKAIETVLKSPYQQAGVGMMLQLMPTQTKGALGSNNPQNLLTMQLGCSPRGALWALGVNKISLPCGSTGAHALDAIVNRYGAVKKGVVVALGSTPPTPGSLSSGLGAFAGSFNQGAFGATAGMANPVLAALGGSQQPGTFTPQSLFSNGSASSSGGSGISAATQQFAPTPSPAVIQPSPAQVPVYSSNANGGVVGYASPSTGNITMFPSDGSTAAVDEGASVEPEPIATIACVSDAGRTRVRWSCMAGTSASRGLAVPGDGTFSTRGALAGVVTVYPRSLTEYTVQCIKNQLIMGEQSCKLKPAAGVGVTQKKQMVLSISSNVQSPSTMRRGKRATITWSTIRATACTVSGEGLAAEGEDGEEDTDVLRRAGSYVYILECEDAQGETDTARTRVEVR